MMAAYMWILQLSTVRMTLSFFQDFDIGQGKGHSDRESDPQIIFFRLRRAMHV